MTITYQGRRIRLTEAEENALADFGADVAAGDMTDDEAVEIILEARAEYRNGLYLDCGPQAWDDR